MNTRSLTNGRDRSKGWTQDENGNWTPSTYDRRRVAVAHMNLLAEVNHVDVIPGPVALMVLAAHSKETDEDCREMILNFGEWMKNAQNH